MHGIQVIVWSGQQRRITLPAIHVITEVVIATLVIVIPVFVITTL